MTALTPWALSGHRTSAALTGFPRAKLGANNARFPATPGHIQPQSPQVSGEGLSHPWKWRRRRARLTAGACRWPVNALGPVRGPRLGRWGMSGGELLIGDGVTARIVRIGDTVGRPLRPFSLTVLLYLAHLRDAGFTGAPLPFGVTSRGARCCGSSPVRCRTARRRVSGGAGAASLPPFRRSGTPSFDAN